MNRPRRSLPPLPPPILPVQLIITKQTEAMTNRDGANHRPEWILYSKEPPMKARCGTPTLLPSNGNDDKEGRAVFTLPPSFPPPPLSFRSLRPVSENQTRTKAKGRGEFHQNNSHVSAPWLQSANQASKTQVGALLTRSRAPGRRTAEGSSGPLFRSQVKLNRRIS